MTKYDLADNQAGFSPQRSDRDASSDKTATSLMSEKEEHCTSDDVESKKMFKKFEKTVAENLSLEGSMNRNSIRWVSYVDEHSDNNPHIENIALKFVKKMMEPNRTAARNPNGWRHAVNAFQAEMKIWAKKKYLEIKGKSDITCILVLALLVVVFAFFVHLLTEKV